MERMLEVKYGSIYNKYGTMIDNMAVIIDKEGGLLKYGDIKDMDDYFKEITQKYTEAGLTDILNDMIYVTFDRYDGILSIDEVCVFVNYMILCSANGSVIMKMLHMDKDSLKKRLLELKEWGY